MNRKIRTVALFAVLSLAATSCQKEEMLPFGNTEQTAETIQVVYSINGDVFQVTISESEKPMETICK